MLICGTKNINKNVPTDVVKGIKCTIQLVKCKFYNCRVIVSGILPRDFSPGILKNKTRLVNIQQKNTAGEMNNITYLDPDHTCRTSQVSTLNMNLYYKNNLHLIEKENEKLAKAITTTFNLGALTQQQNLPEITYNINKNTHSISRNTTTTTNKMKASNIRNSSKNIK